MKPFTINRNNCSDKAHKHLKNTKRAFGFFIVLIGTLLLIKNMNIIPAPYVDFIISWQMLLIVVGIMSFIKNNRIHFSGLVLVGIGVFFILNKIYVIPFDTFKVIGPILIILLGLSIIFKRINRQVVEHTDETSDPDYIDDVRIFGGGKVIINSQKFKGGKSFTVFGGNELNLSMANMEDGVHVIEMFAVFGGTEFIVPAEWNIKVEVAGVFGGFNDKRTVHPSMQFNKNKTLIIKGLVVFGGGEIKTSH